MTDNNLQKKSKIFAEDTWENPFLCTIYTGQNFDVIQSNNQYYLISSNKVIDKGSFCFMIDSHLRMVHTDGTETLYNTEILKPYPHAENVYRCGITTKKGNSYWVQRTKKDRKKTYLLPQATNRYITNTVLISLLATVAVFCAECCTKNKADSMKNDRQELRENPKNIPVGVRKISAFKYLKQISRPQKVR